MPATHLAIRNYVRNGLSISFELVAVDENGVVDTNYTGTIAFSATSPVNASIPGLPASYTFTAGDQGAQSFNTTIATIENVQIFATDSGGSVATAAVYIGGAGPDSFTGAAGGDVFDPNGSTNDLTGAGGEDTFYLTGGTNNVDGGAGADRLVINGGDNLGNSVALTGSLATGYSGTIAGGGISAAFQGIENFTISTNNNSSDNIVTGDGEDEYSQRALDSSSYIRDTANLGGGIDRVSVDARGTNGTLSFLALNYDGSGEVGLYANGKLGFTNAERFFLQGGNAADDLRGLDYADRFDGNAGNDRIAGRGGDDDLRGGAGDDAIDGDGVVAMLLAADNQNNAGAGASDNDFRVNGNYTAANPFEADLAVGQGSAGIVRLRIRATDVETLAADTEGVGENDQVYVNDVLVGTLAQTADNATGDSIFTFDAALLAGGVARIRIQNVNGNGVYNFTVQDVELTLEKTGNDRLDGGVGIDQLVGGRGDDVYVVDQDRDQAQEQGSQGTDTVLSQGRWFTLGANVENLGVALPTMGVLVTGESFVSAQSLGGAQFPRNVTPLADGGYVVAWWDSNNGGDARARIYNADGTPRSSELQVTEVNQGNEGQNGLSAVQLANGNILFATYATGGSGGEQILGRLFNASGVPQGGEFVLADATNAYDAFPALGRLNSGQVALVWQNSDDGAGYGLSYRLLNADGSVGAAPVTFNTTITNDQREPVMARLDDGRLVVAWESQEPGGDVIRGRFINADGTLAANDFPISLAGGDQYRASITGINGGGFAATWEQGGQLLGRVYGSDGLPVGSQFTVSETAITTEINSVTRLPEGGFMVSWASFGGEDGAGLAVLGRLFNGDGSPRGGNFVINEVGHNYQNAPSLTTLANGNVVAAFGSEAFQGGNYDVKQILIDTTPDQTLVGNELANTIAGGFSNDIVAGSGGGDMLTGNQGADIIYGGEFTGSGTNFVVNGSFETQDGTNVTRDYILTTPDGTADGIAYRGVPSLFGWQRGNTAAPIELNTANGSQLFATADGTANINLEYAGNQQQTIFQDVAGLTAGARYVLRFAASQMPLNANYTATTQVVWNGVVVDTITPETKTPGFYSYVLEAMATGSGVGGANRLEFRDISSGDGAGATLDAISLEALVAAPDMAVGAFGPNLIVNGSFEQRDASTSSRDYTLTGTTDFNGGEPIYRFSDQLLGWSFATGTTRIEFNIDNPNNPRNEFQTGDGLVGLDLSVGSESENFGIFQDVAGLAAGQRYRITVSAALPIGPDQSAALQVIWNGRVVGTITPTSLTPTDYSFDVFAQAQGAGAGGANRIALQEVGGSGGSARGTVLDNVRLNLVAAADAGADTVDYSAEAGTGNVTVNLATGTATDSFGAADTLISIENAKSGAGNDSLTGNGGVNVLDGGSGNDTLDGGGAADMLIGGAGDDTYLADTADTITEGVGGGTDEIRTAAAIYSMAAFANVENLTGTSGAGQSLTGNSGVNTITGAGGADTLDGGGAADTLVGGLGNDIYIADTSDTITEGVGGGTDEIRTAAATYSMAAFANVENLTGTSGAGQSLTGNSGVNVITGAGGADTLNGGGAADTLIGGGGNDIYIADATDTITEGVGGGTDEIRTAVATFSIAALANVENLTGTSGAGQSLTGNGGVNVITGAGGADTLDGGGAADSLVGGGGNDIYLADAADTITEAVGGGTDEIRTAAATYSMAAFANVENLTGTSGAGQSLTGNSGVNTITGSGGADTLDGGGAADTLVGGLGNDIYIVDASDIVTEAAGGGTDEVRTAAAVAALSSYANVENLTGTSGAGQSLTGNSGVNVITGAGGADTLDGGGAADTLIGGGGNDIYLADATDTITEGAGGGTDEIRTAAATYSIAAFANVENLTGTSGAGQSLTGNSGVNTITGAGGAETLDGGGAADTLIGGGGNDIYLADAADTVTEAAGGGTDEIRTSAATYSMAAFANVENLTGTSGAGQSLTGNSGVNVITGAGGADTLNGGGAADSLIGGGGNDIYIVDASDIVTEAAGGGTDEIRTAAAVASLSSYANVENLTGTSGAGQSLTGNSGVNVITGAAGADTLDGGAAADTMIGGAGSDIYMVDNAGDVVTEAAGAAGGTADEVRTALASYVLPDNVEILTYTGTGAATLRDNAGNNSLAGSDAAELFYLSAGGSDAASGGAGNDGFYFGGALDGGDSVNGGAGIDDQIGLQGSYAGLVLNGANFSGVETFALLAGNDTRFGADGTGTSAYSLSLVGAWTGNTIFSGNGLRSTEAMTIDASGVSTGTFTFFGGLGAETLTGGGGDDGFFFGAGLFDPLTDKVNGGGGTDNQMALRGNYTVTIGDGALTDIQTLVLISGNDPRYGALGPLTYSIALAANSIDTVAFTVNAQGLAAGSIANVDASAENASFVLIGGGGGDTFRGGSGTNSMFGGLGRDQLYAGTGETTFVYTEWFQSTATAFDTIRQFDANDVIDLAAIDANVLVAGNNDFTFIGSAAFSGTGAASAGELQLTFDGTFHYAAGDINGDGNADFHVRIETSGGYAVTSADFMGLVP